jgi:hypothetical protein
MPPRRSFQGSENERRNLIVRKGELAALYQHPAWPVLVAVLDERREKLERELLAMALGGNGMSLERQAFIRGFFKGVGYVLSIPSNAETRLAEILSEEAA